MTAMNQALIQHLKSQAFSFEAHEISGKKIKNQRIGTEVQKWHSLPSDLVYVRSEPAQGREFNAPNDSILSGGRLAFSWRTVHDIGATILIQIGDESQDSFDLRTNARDWVKNHSEAALDEVRTSVSEFLAATGFESSMNSVKINSTGSYQSFKIIAAGEKRCIQIVVQANLQEPIEFLSMAELKQAVKAYCSPVMVGAYSHLRTAKDCMAAIEQIHADAIESVNA